MKLWQKESAPKSSELLKKVEKFTVGSDKHWDMYLAKYDVEGSLAHAQMLHSIGLLNHAELLSIQEGLMRIKNEIHLKTFIIEEGIEDVHSQIELLLTRYIGEAGKKIHTGRSRNDQSLLDIKLFIRHELESIAGNVKELFELLQHLSEKYKDVLLPGYTHLQVAMPSSFGLWFGAYAESLTDDLELLIAAYHIVNRNPLGSAAGYGSSFPLDRQHTTDSLGFESMNYNVVYAQMTRGKTEKITAIALSTITATLGKLSTDICLYMSQNFGFISFPDELTTGSSIMPHKKNPDVFELIRAKCNRIQALPNELTLLTSNLPSGYHRDMQLTKECLFPAVIELKSCLEMAVLMLQHIRVKDNLLEDDKYKYLFSVEKVNELVLSGVPFREAYRIVGKEIEAGNFTPCKHVKYTHEGSIGNLCNDKIAERFLKLMGEINLTKEFQPADNSL